MKLALLTLLSLVGGLFALERAAHSRSARWAGAAAVLFALAYSLDVLLVRI
jgi:hypothetical protein